MGNPGTLYDASNTIIQKNTILDDNPLVNGADQVWIRINAPGTGGPNLIEDNLTNAIIDKGAALLLGNQEIDQADYDDWFVDWQNYHFKLRLTAPLQFVGAPGFSGGSTMTILPSSSIHATSFGPSPTAVPVPVPMSGLMALTGIVVLMRLRRRRLTIDCGIS